MVYVVSSLRQQGTEMSCKKERKKKKRGQKKDARHYVDIYYGSPVDVQWRVGDAALVGVLHLCEPRRLDAARKK